MINGAANTTFQTGDIINGNVATGDDAVNVTVAAPTGEANGPLVQISNIKNVNFRTLAATPVNAQLFTNVNNVNSTGSNSILTINNGALASNYGLSNTIATTVDGLAIGIRAGDLTGTSTANVSVSNVGTGTTAAQSSQISTTTTGIENVAIATSGTNNFTFTGVTTAATDSATLTLTGAGNNTVTIANGGMATTATVDGSALTGNLTLIVGTNLSTGDTYKAGAGTADVLNATTSGQIVTNLNVSGFETLRLDSGAVASSIVFASSPSLTTVRLDAGTGGIVKTLTNIGSFTNLNFVGTSTAATVANAFAFNAVTASGGFSGASDTVAVGISNGGLTTTNAAPYTLSNINLNGVENFNFTVTDNTANAPLALGDVISNTVTSVSFTTNGLVTMAGGNEIQSGGVAAVNTLSSVSLAGVTGVGVSTVRIGDAGVTAGLLAASATITASAGGTTAIVNSAEAASDILTFTGGAGADTLTNTLYAGNVIFNGGAGGDTYTQTANAATASVTGGDGVDTFTIRTTSGASITDLGFGGADNLSNQAGATTATVTVNWTAGALTTIAGGTVTLNAAAGVTTINVAGATAAGVGWTINASTSNSTITGDADADTINGNSGSDTLVGNAGADTITTGAGATNNVTGGADADAMTGGTGVDTFVQGTADSVAESADSFAGANFAAGDTITFGGGLDVINSFTAGAGGDVLDLAVAIQAVTGIGVATGTLVAGTNYFLSGNYNAGTGVFTVAADGLGADTLIVQGYAGVGTDIATNTSDILLVGVNSANLVAGNFA